MKSTLRSAGTVAICGALALATCACAKRQAPPPRPPASVKTAPALKTDAPIVINAFGATKDRASVDVVPQVSGVLVQTHIRDGAVVTNGQPLFQIDPRDYASRVRQVEAALAADRAALALANGTLERNRTLLEKKMISSEVFDTLKAHAEAATAQLQADEALLEQAQLNLARCTITAPLAGVCSRRYVDDGNLVGAGQTRLVNIRSYDPIYLDFAVSEVHLSVLRQAMAEGTVRIEITPRGDTNTYAGTVASMDNTVSTPTGTIALRGLVPNPELKLWAGQFADVSVIAGIVRDAVMVPEGAVQYGKQGTYLFAVSPENKAELRPVQIGLRHHDQLQITAGVAPGENVVVLGQMMLYPGAAVADVDRLPPAGAAGTGAPTGDTHGSVKK